MSIKADLMVKIATHQARCEFLLKFIRELWQWKSEQNNLSNWQQIGRYVV